MRSLVVSTQTHTTSTTQNVVATTTTSNSSPTTAQPQLILHPRCHNNPKTRHQKLDPILLPSASPTASTTTQSNLSPLRKSTKEWNGMLPKIGGISPERKRPKHDPNSDPSKSLSKRSHSTSHRFLDVMVTNQPLSPSKCNPSSNSNNINNSHSSSNNSSRRTRSNFNSQRTSPLTSSLPSPRSGQPSSFRKFNSHTKPGPIVHAHSKLNQNQTTLDSGESGEDDEHEDSQLTRTLKTKQRENLIKHLFKETNQDLTVHKDLLINPFQNLSCTSILPEIPRPQYPDLSDKNQSMFTKLVKIQNFISAFEYNYIEQHFFDITRLRPLKSIIQTAKEVIQDCLPIRCVEGTFLSLFCTQEFEEVDRFSVFFQTTMTQRVYRHIVCAIRFKGRFGALGLSRKVDLFYKPLMYFKISELLREYILSYSKYGHTVQLIYVSLPISHDSSSREIPVWNFVKLDFEKGDIDSLMDKADKYMSEVTSHNGDKLLERKKRKLKPPSSQSSDDDDEQETNL